MAPLKRKRHIKMPPGVWFKRYGIVSPEAKLRTALTKRSKKIKVTLPKLEKHD